MAITDIRIIQSCILGHAVADALGVPVEFSDRGERLQNPVTGMLGHGTYDMPAGSWSDDTSMTLCALEALAQERFSWESVMRNFGKWYYDGEFTPTGKTFDVGSTSARAIEAYFAGKQSVEHCGRSGERDNGNGSLMRILPFILYAPHDLAFIEKASSLTHAHRVSQMACGIYALVLTELLDKKEKSSYRVGLHQAELRYGRETEWKLYAPLLDIENRTCSSIRSSGYVVDTLEAALWCLLTTDSYRECVLKAVNLGSDTDTVAAVAGGLAGALYGLESIPQEWLDALLRREYIEALCENAQARWIS